MVIVDAFGRRRIRTLALGLVAVAWLFAVIGAAADHQALLAVGLALAGVIGFKLQLENESRTRRDIAAVGHEASKTRAAVQRANAGIERRIDDHDRSRAELHSELWTVRRFADALGERAGELETVQNEVAARLAELEASRDLLLSRLDETRGSSRRFTAQRPAEARRAELTLSEALGGLVGSSPDEPT